jgi:hypothetical protein
MTVKDCIEVVRLDELRRKFYAARASLKSYNSVSTQMFETGRGTEKMQLDIPAAYCINLISELISVTEAKLADLGVEVTDDNSN